ncbi:MAG: GIY-YIG nuclease family protein [Bacteroidales bacterium]|nr:GIY-YIG nuclease family protein [Bacteroidales bacterium]
MFYVYIIHPKSIDKFYIGQTLDIKQRISEHNSGTYYGSFYIS